MVDIVSFTISPINSVDTEQLSACLTYDHGKINHLK